MRATFEHLNSTYPTTWRYTRFTAARMDPYWHFHEEFELTWVIRGTGDRLIGDSVEDYRPGDVVLIGPNLPHTYVSSPDSTALESIVIHFKRDFLGSGFLESPAFSPVTSMFDAATGGIWFSGTPSVPVGLADLPPAERTVELLRLLVALSREEYVLLTAGERPPVVGRELAVRVESMVAAIRAGYQSPLTLETIAKAANMNASAASRLFARCTGTTVMRYVATIRVNAACRLLRETDQSVSWIAGESGFSNLSNFNRRFRELKGMSPSDYRTRLQSGSSALAVIDVPGEPHLSALYDDELVMAASAKIGLAITSYRSI